MWEKVVNCGKELNTFTALRMETSFIGEYDAKVDAKGRVLFPAGLKKQLSPKTKGKFIINRGFEGCLVMFPKDEWQKEMTKLNRTNLYKTKDRKFIRLFHNGAQPLDLDSVGRVLLPKKLMEAAAIDKEVTFFAYANRIEVWSKSKYEEVMKIDDDDYASLAEDVMGKDNDGDNEVSQ